MYSLAKPGRAHQVIAVVRAQNPAGGCEFVSSDIGYDEAVLLG